MKTGFIKRHCPKCGGNLYHDEDSYFDGYIINYYEHESCLQCGYDCYSDLMKIEEGTTEERRELLPV